MIATTNSTEGGTQTETYEVSLCSSSLLVGLQQQSIYFSVLNIFLSITAFLGNFLILVALNKESSLHAPSKLLYRCLATTDLLVGLSTQPLAATYWMSVVHKHWSLCRHAVKAIDISSYALCGVSLFTLTAISVDRLLALLLGIRYRQIVTLKRTYIIAATFWILPVGAGSISISHSRIIRWYSIIGIALCSVISIASYTKIFRTLRHHQAQVQDHVQQQPSQETALNMERYRKVVSSALWVQLALAVCYVPKFIILVVINHSKTYSSRLVVIDVIASILVYFNSTLNPFLYCWRIREVRQAVKQTIRQALCFPWT
ncbi:melanocyte-stimulating hormone receptor-like [Pocillopora verrucosa]|uniref:melanocyte-stimulating hormone receptor-like n=1 Tax=Pocillopora verrucosa TaxID=203993 RepID=UPI003341F850